MGDQQSVPAPDCPHHRHPPPTNPSEQSKPIPTPPQSHPPPLFQHTFRWRHGASQVSIAGSFCNWENILMSSNGAEFLLTVQLSAAGWYQYKFLVDEQWRCAEDQPMVADSYGN
jgi:hypothetical protein